MNVLGTSTLALPRVFPGPSTGLLSPVLFHNIFQDNDFGFSLVLSHKPCDNNLMWWNELVFWIRVCVCAAALWTDWAWCRWASRKNQGAFRLQ